MTWRPESLVSGAAPPAAGRCRHSGFAALSLRYTLNRMHESGAQNGPSAAVPAAGSKRGRGIGLIVLAVVLALLLGALALFLTRRQSSQVDVLWSYATDSVQLSAQPAAGGTAVLSVDDALVGLDAATGAQRWRLDRRISDVVVDGDRIYAGCCRDVDSGPTSLLAVDAADGKVRWQADRRNAGRSIPMSFAPATPVDDMVVVSSNDDEVFALDADTGRQLWSVAARVFGTPTVAGGVVAVAGTGRAIGIDLATGDTKWEFTTDPALELSDPVALGGDFVFTSSADFMATDEPAVAPSVFALDASTGERAWEHRTDAVELTAPVQSGDLVVTGVQKSFDGQDLGVLAFDGTSSRPVWVAPGLGEVDTPVVGPAGIYVAPQGTPGVVALDPGTGATSWEYRFDESGPGPIVLTSDLVWVGGNENELVGFDPASGAVQKQYQAASAIVSLTPDGDTLFLGTYLDGFLALDTSG